MITFLCLAGMTGFFAWAFNFLWKNKGSFKGNRVAIGDFRPRWGLVGAFATVQTGGATLLSLALTLIWASDSLGFSDVLKSEVEADLARQASQVPND